ncbi:MAG TPA: putative aminohydrolase SsnA [Tissierellia bacterium]|nr:putative aminohydrolase SsnA [Tissierellia bacterium]
MIIRNARIFTNDADNHYYETGFIQIQDGLITQVGAGEGPADPEVIDAKGKIMLPGLINLHNHIYSALSRGVYLPKHNPNNFLEILEGMWWNLDRNLDNPLVALSARATYYECIKNGVTTIFDHHASFSDVLGSLETIAKESRQAGMRSCLCFEVTDRYGKDKSKQSIDENLQFIEEVRQDGRDDLRALFGLHASFTLDDETLADISRRLPEEVGTHFHLSEGIDDEIHAQELGTTPLRRLIEHGLVKPNSLAIHGIHLGDDDFSLLKDTGAAVIHNPQSNMGNAVGYCPVLKFLGHDIPVGLGTDGYTQDMIETARIAALMMRHENKNPRTGWVEPYDMLLQTNAELATKHFGLTLGRLEAGAGADLILLDYVPYTPFGGDNLSGHLHFGMNGAMVSDTMAKGQWLMRDRQVLTIDEADLVAEASAAAEGLWEEMKK